MTNIPPKKLYWDSSCFICLLDDSPASSLRRSICNDVLKHAELGEVEIWISTWVIVEVIRPKKRGMEPLPLWAVESIKAVPMAKEPIEELWARYQRNAPSNKLSKEQIERIQGMFEWPFIKKMYVDDRIAAKAVELSRDYGLKPGDSVHAASAILKPCDELQNWDKDFDRIKLLINVQEPKMLTPKPPLFEDIAEEELIGSAFKEHESEPAPVPTAAPTTPEVEGVVVAVEPKAEVPDVIDEDTTEEEE
jgi:predicted nucleic acid-binding protein